LNSEVARNYSQQVTHVVTPTMKKSIAGTEVYLCNRTLKYMEGIIGGKWVLSYDWVLESKRNKGWVPEDPFLVQGDQQFGAKEAAKKGRQRVADVKPGLFYGMKFCLYGKFTPQDPSEDALKNLIESGDGKVVPYNAGCTDKNWGAGIYLLCSPDFVRNPGLDYTLTIKAESGLMSLSLVWVLDSICGYEKIDINSLVYRFDLAAERQRQMRNARKVVR